MHGDQRVGGCRGPHDFDAAGGDHEKGDRCLTGLDQHLAFGDMPRMTVLRDASHLLGRERREDVFAPRPRRDADGRLSFRFVHGPAYYQVSVSSGSSASCGGRRLSGTCCRLTRIRVQVRIAAAHRIDQDVGRLQVRRRVRVPGPPALETGQRILFLLCAPDLDQRKLRRAAAGRLDPRRLAFLLPVMRRPRSVAQAFLLMTVGQLEQPRQLTDLRIDLPRVGRPPPQSVRASSSA